MTTVLIAVDGTDTDRSVTRQVLHLFGPDCHYVVVNVAERPLLMGAIPVGYGIAAAVPVPELSRFSDGIESQAQAARATAEHVVEDAGLPDAEAVGEVGDPASILLSSAEEHHADVIAVGTCDRSWISRLFDPSVSEAVIHRADRAVLVLREEDPPR